jgi:hypothetical protein
MACGQMSGVSQRESPFGAACGLSRFGLAKPPTSSTIPGQKRFLGEMGSERSKAMSVSEDQKAQIIFLLEQGWSSKEIAKKLGVGKMVVAGYKAVITKATNTPANLKTATPTIVREYIARFDQQEAGVENAIAQLLLAFPKNELFEDVLLKVIVINRLYNTNIFAVHAIAEGICKLALDSKLASRSLDVVNEIADIDMPGKKRRNYSFATKYCNWHAPDEYPIYDSSAGRLLLAYLNNDGVPKPDLQDYRSFAGAVESFRIRHGLSDLTFKEIDKFLWMYSQEVFAPLAPKRMTEGVSR